DIISDLLETSLETAELSADGWKNKTEEGGSVTGKYINWLTFKNNAKSVVEDVQRIKNHPLVPKHIPVHGYIYDCKTGRLIEVPEASK
ncbi:MAG: carbonic anhydrase, partial [Alphaproteobacteria bacterium]